MGKNNSRKRGASLLALLLVVAMLFGLAGNVTPAEAATNNYYIRINKGTNVVTVYESNGTPYVAFTCSAGSATPIGTFYTMQKYRWHTLDGPCYGQYCTRITGSILFHSVWYYQQTMNSQSYVQYNKLGTLASHGCVRLTVASCKWIYDNCPLRTKVTIFNGTSKDDPLGKPKTIRVSSASMRGWDPTDPDSRNPYKTKSTKPTITVSKNTFNLGDKFDKSVMSCKDSGGNDITSWVRTTGTVNTKKVGNYPVTYWVIDSFGRTATKTVTYKVVDTRPATLTGVKETLTKEYKSSRNLLTGLKAKDSSGTNLNDKIEVYIKVPGSKSYVKCKKTEYTFGKVGTYNVKFIVTNPSNNKKTTKKQKIVVRDTKAPQITSDAGWPDIAVTDDEQTLSWKDLMGDISARLRSGKDLTNKVTIKITSPSGESVTISKGESYTFEESGTYELLYTTKNPTKNAKGNNASAKETRNAVVELAEEIPQPEPEPEPQPEVIVDE